MEIVATSGHIILADDADADLLSKFSWYVNRAGSGRPYAQARVSRGPRIYMHRLLMDPPRGMVVHHRNNNGLDNRRANLEIATNRQNILYARENSPPVHIHKQTGKWRAQPRDETGRQVSLGLYQTREAAIEAVVHYRAGKSP